MRFWLYIHSYIAILYIHTNTATVNIQTHIYKHTHTYAHKHTLHAHTTLVLHNIPLLEECKLSLSASSEGSSLPFLPEMAAAKAPDDSLTSSSDASNNPFAVLLLPNMLLSCPNGVLSSQA